APSPYPSPQPTHLFGTGSYCDAPASGNGWSLTTGYPLDYYKLNDIVYEGIQWTRTLADPYYIDNTHATGGYGTGVYNWYAWDATQCQLIRNNILPTVDVNTGPVIYNGAATNPEAVYP